MPVDNDNRMNRPDFSAQAISLTLAPGQVAVIDALEYLVLLSTSASLEVKAGRGSWVPLGSRRGFRARKGGIIGQLSIRNNTVSTITNAVLVTGDGDYADFQAYTASAPIHAVIDSPNPLPVSWAVGGMAVHGPDAPGATVTQNPVLVGGKADDGKAYALRMDREGRALSAAAIPSDAVRGMATFAAAGPLAVLADPGAAKALCVTSVLVVNDGLIDDTVILYDDVTEFARVSVKAGTSVPLHVAAPGIVITTHKALNADVVVGAGVGYSVRVFAAGYKANV